MSEYKLSDPQWLILDLLMQRRKNGHKWTNRMEILASPNLPEGAALKLTWAALTMPEGLIKWFGKDDFAITDEGASLYNLRFGTAQKTAEPSGISDGVICLPDLSQRH